jgi:glycosyl transferase, family 25
MRAYYINLDRRTDRREAMEARFAALGIAAERVTALTPSDITAEQRAKYCNPNSWRWKSEAELSCSLTHVKIMRQLIASEEPMAAIFEDDAVLAPDLGRFLAEFEKASLDIDLLHMETDNTSVRLPPNAEEQVGRLGLFRLFSSGRGSAGYVITRKAALRIVDSEEIRVIQTDQALFGTGPLSRGLVIRQLVPALVIQEDRLGLAEGERGPGSDLQALRRQRIRANAGNFWRRLPHTLRDFVMRDIVKANYNRWLKFAHGVRKRQVPFAGGQ